MTEFPFAHFLRQLFRRRIAECHDCPPQRPFKINGSKQDLDYAVFSRHLLNQLSPIGTVSVRYEKHTLFLPLRALVCFTEKERGRSLSRVCEMDCHSDVSVSLVFTILTHRSVWYCIAAVFLPYRPMSRRLLEPHTPFRSCAICRTRQSMRFPTASRSRSPHSPS